MKFFAEPNLLVRLNKPIGLLKYIRFSELGEYYTENEVLIKKLKINFKSKNTSHSCKYCDLVFNSMGDLLVHYRKHKEVKQ
jgi:hypothetical protein